MITVTGIANLRKAPLRNTHFLIIASAQELYGLPDFICLGSFKRDWLLADRAIYFSLAELHC